MGEFVNKQVPLLSVRDTVVLPYTSFTLYVGRDISKNAVLKSVIDGHIFVCAQLDSDVELPSVEDVFSIGTLVSVENVNEMLDSSLEVRCRGLSKGRLVEVEQKEGCAWASVELELKGPRPVLCSLPDEIENLFDDFVRLSSLVGVFLPQGKVKSVRNAGFVDEFSYLIVDCMDISYLDRRLLFEIEDDKKRLEEVGRVLSVAVRELESVCEELSQMYEKQDVPELFERLLEQVPAYGTTRSLGDDGVLPEQVEARLQVMFDVDQFWRHALMDKKWSLMASDKRKSIQELIAKELAGVDERHLNELRAWVDVQGWPRLSVYGDRICLSAWLIAQHADADLEFQKFVLAEMELLLPEKDVKPSLYACLYDRVAVNSKLPQRYGTQMFLTSTSQWKPYELENPDAVDAYRSEMNLEPLEVYVERQNYKNG